MYFADDTTDIKVKLSGAVTTTELPIVGCSSRIVEATGAMDAATVIHTVTAGTAEITVVDGGADSAKVTKLQGLAVRNSDTVAATVTVYQDDGSNERIIVRATLAVGDTLMLADDGMWDVIDLNGRLKRTISAATLSTVTAVLALGTLADGDIGTRQAASFVGMPQEVVCGGRLTLTTAVPVTTSDVTAATTVYFTPHVHDKISLFDGTRWKRYTFTEKSIGVTNTQSTTASTASTNLTVADSSQLMRGMVIASTEVTGGQTIVSITSATVVVMSAVANANGTSSTTFKIPVGKNVDIFGVVVSDALVLRFGNFWSSDTARADALGDQNGKNNVNNAAINSADSNTIDAKEGLYLGTVRTTATAGQTEDSFAKRFCWNQYNRTTRHLAKSNSTSHTYNSATVRAWNNETTNSRVEFVIGFADFVWIHVSIDVQPGASGIPTVGASLDSTTVFTGPIAAVVANATPALIRVAVDSVAVRVSGSGYHFLQALENDQAAVVSTFAAIHINMQLSG